MEQTIIEALDLDLKNTKRAMIEVNKEIIQTILEIRIPNLTHNPEMAKQCLDIIHKLQRENKEMENDLKRNQYTNDSGTINWH